MAHALLDHLQRQSEPAIRGAVDQSRGVEVPQGVQAGILRPHHRPAIPVDLAHLDRDASRDHRGHQAPVDDVGMAFYLAGAVREDEPERTFRTGELPLAQRVDDDRWQRDSPLAGLGLRPADLAKLVGALADRDRARGKVDVLPSQAAFARGKAIAAKALAPRPVEPGHARGKALAERLLGKGKK